MSSQPDLGRAVVDDLYRVLQIDAEWSVREDRGFTWWPCDLRQRVWLEPTADGAGSVRIHIETPLARHVADSPETYALGCAANLYASFSAVTYDPTAKTISMRTSATLTDGDRSWISKLLYSAAALQVAVPANMAEPVAASFHGTVDHAVHPTSGGRPDRDDMLNVLGLYASQAGRPSRFRASDFARLARACRGRGIDVTADGAGAVAGLLTGDAETDVALLLIMPQEHPAFGTGLLAVLTLPGERDAAVSMRLANVLNLAEAARADGCGFGAWYATEGRLHHICFLPNLVTKDWSADSRALLLEDLVADAGLRASWATETLRHDPEVDAVVAATPSGAPARRALDPSRQARTVVVAHDGSGDYLTIKAALEAAGDGDTIRARPGVYVDPLLLDVSVEIAGDGPREAIVIEVAGEECVRIVASGVTIRGLTVRPARVPAAGSPWSAIWARDVDAVVEDCDLSSHLGATVWVGGSSGTTTIRGCRIHDGAQNGIAVMEGGSAIVEDNEVTATRWPGVFVTGERAAATVRRSRIESGCDWGICAVDGGTVVAEANTVRCNSAGGILLGDAGPASRLLGNTIAANRNMGIKVAMTVGVEVAENVITSNQYGITIESRSTPLVRANQILGNTCLGIGVSEAGTHPVVTANTIIAKGGSAIVVRDGAGGTFEGNTVSASETAGILVQGEGSDPLFRANIVKDGRGVAVAVTDGAGGVFEANDLRGNRDGTWSLDDSGAVRRSGNLEDAPQDIAVPALGTGSTRHERDRRPPGPRNRLD